MSLAYPGESSALSDTAGRDAFLSALDDQAQRVRILEKKPNNLEDALNLVGRLEAFEMMASTRSETVKRKSRFVRAAADGKESIGSGETKLSENVLKQPADLKGLMCSCRRDLEKQQQEIEGLNTTYQSPSQGSWNPRLNQVQQERSGLGRAVLSRSPLSFRVIRQSLMVVVQPGTKEDTERLADLNRGTLVGIVEERSTGIAMRGAEGYGSALADPQGIGGSVSIVTDGRNGVEVYLVLTLNGRGVDGLLDTGYDTSVVSRRVIPNERLKPTTQKLYAANETEIALLGEVELALMLADYEVTAAVVVSEEVDDFILGIDWVDSLRCRWSFAKNLIEIDGKVVRLIIRPRRSMLRRIYAVEDTVVPAGHANEPVTTALLLLRPTSDNWAMEPWSLGTVILATMTLMRDEGRRSVAQVMNVGETDFVPARRVHQRIEQVTTVENEEAASRPPDQEEVFSEEATVPTGRPVEESDLEESCDDAHVQVVIDDFPPLLNSNQPENSFVTTLGCFRSPITILGERTWFNT